MAGADGGAVWEAEEAVIFVQPKCHQSKRAISLAGSRPLDAIF